MSGVALMVLAVQLVLPGNTHAGLLTREMVALWHASPTFRAQCERIAAARNLRVDVELVQTLGTPRADMAFARYQAGAMHADVRIGFGQDYRELLAHEFEHIIEQLDGVDLRVEAARGRAWLVDAHVFETVRASEAGRRARRESDTPMVDDPAARPSGCRAPAGMRRYGRRSRCW